MVGFIDFAPTLLSILGIEPPGHMQGRAFAGKFIASEPEYQFGFRGRMDERYDMVRSVRNQRYVYIRNFMPHRIYGQFIQYMFETPTTRVWKQLFDQQRLTSQQRAFWEEKPPEELYDLLRDPDEVVNEAMSTSLEPVLRRMRDAMGEWQLRIRDLGFLPEGEIHSRSANASPYEMGHDDYRYPVQRVKAMAEIATAQWSEGTANRLRDGFRDADSAVRYWAATGALIHKEEGLRDFHRELGEALRDPSPYVRIVAAETLGRFGTEGEAQRALGVLLDLASLDRNNVYISMMALNAIDYMDQRAAGAKERIASLPQKRDDIDLRMAAYVPNLIEKILADLK
jgi:uncharacterized sulfatase